MGNFCQFLEKCPFSGKPDLWNKRPPRGSRSHSVYTVGHSRFDCVSFCPGVRNGEKSPPFFQKLTKIALFSRNCQKLPFFPEIVQNVPGDKSGQKCPRGTKIVPKNTPFLSDFPCYTVTSQ